MARQWELSSSGLILLLKAMLGVWQETKAEASLARLKTMAARQVWVLRDGRLEQSDRRESAGKSDPPWAAAAPLLDGPSRRFIKIVSGVSKGAFAFGILAMAPAGWMESVKARSAMFDFMSIGQLFFAYPARHTHVRPSRNHYLCWR